MAAGAKAKSGGATNGSAPKVKPGKTTVSSSPTASGTATPIGDEAASKGFTTRVSKPDKAAFDAEQETLKAKINELQQKVNEVQSKINGGSNAGPEAGRRAELRAKLEEHRQDQGKSKTSRGQIVAQLKSLNENISAKIKDLQAAKSRTKFKNIAELEAHVKQLEKQVESGSLKLVDEKRALQEISQCKRARKTVENFQAEQAAIDRDRATVEELSKQLDDPEAKALSNSITEIKAELDQIKKKSDEAYANRNKLFEERNTLKAELDELFIQKRESSAKFREDNDRYWNQVHEDRARRAERARAQRQAEEEAKKRETALRVREEAEIPAFQVEIEDCQTLIDYFSGKSSSAKLSNSQDHLTLRAEVSGVPKLDIRQVDADTTGLVARKKKGEEEESYFVGGKGKKNKKSGSSKPAPVVNGNSETSAPSGSLNVPLPTLAALLSMSIPPPVSAADVPRTISDLQTKKAWFEANQARVTAENIAKAEANIKKIMGETDISAPPNGTGESPADPAPTPSDDDKIDEPVPAEEVVAEIESETANGEIEVA